MALYTLLHFHCLIYNCCEICFTLAYSEISLQFSLNLIVPFPILYCYLPFEAALVNKQMYFPLEQNMIPPSY